MTPGSSIQTWRLCTSLPSTSVIHHLKIDFQSFIGCLLLLLLLLLFNLLKNTEHANNNNELSIRESSLHNSVTISTWHKGAVKTQFVATLYGNR